MSDFIPALDSGGGTPQEQAARLNARWPVGTRTRYWTMTRDFLAREGVIRHPWTVLGGHTVVAWIEGCVDCLAADEGRVPQ